MSQIPNFNEEHGNMAIYKGLSIKYVAQVC